MIDPKSLLERFLGPGASPGAGHGAAPGASAGARPPGAGSGSFADMARGALARAVGPGGFAGGAATGGVLGLLLGGKKGRNLAGGVLSHGGAAVLGALAYRAYQNWQQGQAPASAPLAAPQDAAAMEPRFLPDAAPSADGLPFELALVRAMVGAAKADGHIDDAERGRIFERVEHLGLDPEAKAFVFDAIERPTGVSEVAAAARTPEQAAEIYLASRLAVDPDQPAERAYLEALAHRLQLAPDLAAHLDRQVEALLPPPPGANAPAR